MGHCKSCGKRLWTQILDGYCDDCKRKAGVCMRCNGYGKVMNVPHAGYRVCPRCGGSGRAY